MNRGKAMCQSMRIPRTQAKGCRPLRGLSERAKSIFP